MFPYSPEFLTIPSKKSAPISCTFIPQLKSSTASEKRLIVFLNGLGLPASSWESSLSYLLQDQLNSTPAILTYDRYGQGRTTSRDPVDSQPGNEDGHDYLDVVGDLNEIINTVGITKLGLQETDIRNDGLALLLVCASIGCNIGRLYAQHYPRMVAGLILLDSNIANMNYSQIWPDPDSPSFDSGILEDVTLEEYRVARNKLAAMFDFNVKNAESLNRANSATLLPQPSSPQLVGFKGTRPALTVVGHDPETFADLSYEMMGTPKSLTRNLTNLYWAQYNEALRHITSDEKCGEVVIAKGCGHFIVQDDPKFVAKEIISMIERLAW